MRDSGMEVGGSGQQWGRVIPPTMQAKGVVTRSSLRSTAARSCTHGGLKIGCCPLSSNQEVVEAQHTAPAAAHAPGRRSWCPGC
jgi:hypothetical protein